MSRLAPWLTQGGTCLLLLSVICLTVHAPRAVSPQDQRQCQNARAGQQSCIRQHDREIREVWWLPARHQNMLFPGMEQYNEYYKYYALRPAPLCVSAVEV